MCEVLKGNDHRGYSYNNSKNGVSSQAGLVKRFVVCKSYCDFRILMLLFWCTHQNEKE